MRESECFSTSPPSCEGRPGTTFFPLSLPLLLLTHTHTPSPASFYLILFSFLYFPFRTNNADPPPPKKKTLKIAIVKKIIATPCRLFRLLLLLFHLGLSLAWLIFFSSPSPSPLSASEEKFKNFLLSLDGSGDGGEKAGQHFFFLRGKERLLKKNTSFIAIRPKKKNHSCFINPN